MRIIAFIVAMLAAAASAAECRNCGGQRIVGTGAVHLPCPVCDGTGTIPDPPAAVVPGKPRPAVARVTAADGPSRASGSGVLVRSGTGSVVLTNWHVVRSHRDGITVSWPDGSSGPARVVAWDDAWDLAALSVSSPPAAPVAVAAAAPAIGERLTIAGYGQGKYLEQTGAVTDFLSPTRHHPRQFVEMRAAARQGDSGGPMFNEAGELAGVLWGQREGLTCGSCSTRVAAFLAGLPTKAACADGRCVKR